jgi:hypothetical protein
MRRRIIVGALFTRLMLALTLVGAAAASAQSPIVRPQTPLIKTDFNPAYANLDENQQSVAQALAKRANLERQAQMKADTERLFKLVQELKESVGKSNENILSIDVIRKANEIEKLAHSVKEKMKGPY